MSTVPSSNASKSWAPKLRDVRVSLRSDLEVTRHLFRDQPAYVVRDPLTLTTQRLDLEDYHVFATIDSSRTLGEIFDSLVDRSIMRSEDEETFFRFVITLHRQGFLRLPIADNRLLYRRFKMREQVRRREKISGFLFLRIPVWNPTAFLNRTYRFVRPCFGRVALLIWLVVVLAALYVGVQRSGELTGPIQGLLAAQNLPLMWLTLVVLKVFHEFGHAYMCKHFGGNVPEMGVFLIVFTPCAYVDASAAWGFTSKRARLLVSLAGMWVESFIAALALFVWAFAEEPLIRSVAYNVFFLAGVVTILFNINPLMRFDGYYILSDLTEIPNLRARSTRYLSGWLKRLFLSIPDAVDRVGCRLGLTLAAYGLAASCYRISLLLIIATILMVRFHTVGLILSVFLIGGTILKLVRGLVQYLWYSPEADVHRGRAVAMGLFVLIVLPAASFFVPIPNRINAEGVLLREVEDAVRVKTPGFVDALPTQAGIHVAEGDTLAILRNEFARSAIAIARANVTADDLRLAASQWLDPSRTKQLEIKLKLAQGVLGNAQQRVRDLTLQAPRAGETLTCLRPISIGAYFPEGELVAKIVSGKWQVHVLLSAEQVTRAAPQRGQHVVVRIASDPSRMLEGVVHSVAPEGSRRVHYEALTHSGGGWIAVDPRTGEAEQPYFEIVVRLVNPPADQLAYGTTGTVQFVAASQPLGTGCVRRVARFWNRLAGTRG